MIETSESRTTTTATSTSVKFVADEESFGSKRKEESQKYVLLNTFSYS